MFASISHQIYLPFVQVFILNKSGNFYPFTYEYVNLAAQLSKTEFKKITRKKVKWIEDFQQYASNVQCTQPHSKTLYPNS